MGTHLISGGHVPFSAVRRTSPVKDLTPQQAQQDNMKDAGAAALVLVKIVIHGKSAMTQMIIHIIISTTVTRTNCLGGKNPVRRALDSCSICYVLVSVAQLTFHIWHSLCSNNQENLD